MNPPASAPISTPFNVLYIGAGVINFGSPAQPWNHSLRIERKLGNRLCVVGIVEIRPEIAHAVIDKKRNAKVDGYESTLVFESIQQAGEILRKDPARVPHLAVIGTHPSTRGSLVSGRDAEVRLLKYFPQIALHIEKPLSSGSVQEVEELAAVLRQRGTVTSVGYMLRYLKGVQEMKSLIADNDLTVMATIARFLMAYQFAGQTPARKGFFDKTVLLGPIVEQATHICDLSRYFAPPIVANSYQVHTISHAEEAGHLSQMAHDESTILPENRIPRMTTAIWKYENGACGTLVHGLTLHEGEISVELVVLADGWSLRLVDPYNVHPRLFVRQPGGRIEKEIELGDDDCYFSQFSALIDVVDGLAPCTVIQSSFEDALESYKMVRLAHTVLGSQLTLADLGYPAEGRRKQGDMRIGLLVGFDPVQLYA